MVHPPRSSISPPRPPARRPGRGGVQSAAHREFSHPCGSDVAMRALTLAVCCLTLLRAPVTAAEDGWIDLSSDAHAREGWQKLGSDWRIAGSAALDPNDPRKLGSEPGDGVLVNNVKGKAHDLLTKQKFGDAEVHVEFLIAKGSNSGVKMMGLYEIQIFDSYGRKKLTGADCGGIYPRAELLPKY